MTRLALRTKRVFAATISVMREGKPQVLRDMTQLDPFTLNLLSNDEVLEVDQDPLGKPAARISSHGPLEVWAKKMADGSRALGLFNRGETAANIQVQWSALGLGGEHPVRDLWRQKTLGKFNAAFSTRVPRHGVALVRVLP